MRQVSARVAAAVVLTPLVVGASTAASIARAREALPTATSHVRAALIEASALTSCLQGSQDDLFTPSGGTTAVSRRAAAARLGSCDTDGFRRTTARLTVPRAAPLQAAQTLRRRAALACAVPLLQQAAADGGTARATGLGAGAVAARFVVAYRSFEDAVQQASVLLATAEAG